MSFRRLVVLFLASIVLFFSASAEAQQRSVGPAYKLRLELDLPIVLVAGATASSFFVAPEAPGVHCAPDCSSAKINALDRPAAGLYDPTWGSVGDIATVATLTMPLLAILLHEGLVDGLNDDLVVAEATLVTSALQVVVSYAIGRPRPRVYASDAPLDERTNANAARSFFSGHVADTVATTVAAFRTFQRLGKPGVGWLVLGAGLAGSSLVGVARVASGGHFPTDVIAGAAIGTGLGIALPALHESGARLVPFAGPGGSGLLVAGALP